MENKNYNLWIKNPNLSIEIKNIIKKYNNTEIKKYFNKDIEFGTAGIRGIMGIGSSMFNLITIKKITLAFSKYLIENYSKKELECKGILIGHDTRKNSEIFALECVKILNFMNIKAILFKDNAPVPTPYVSYGIRKIKALSGIVITASHNSKEYNGYKILDINGSQYLPNVTNKINKEYQRNTTESLNIIDIDKPIFDYINIDIDKMYFNDVMKMQFFPDEKRKIKITFSNLHGTSKEITPKILKKANYHTQIVKEQFEYDINFKNAPEPNPEIQKNFKLAHKYAKKNNSDLIILNDPDADRVGVSILHNNKYHILNANEVAPILLKYILNQLKNHKKLPKNGVIYSTFVSSHLIDLIAKKYNIEIVKTLVGFKWIGDLINRNRSKKFLFAYEEACGYILNDIVRDKDGIQTSLVIAEACDFYKKQGKTFIDVLNEIYKSNNYFYCHTINKIIKNKKDKKINDDIFKKLENINIKKIGDKKIVKKEDYKKGLYNMPSQNLLKFYFEDGSWFAVRPSGTESKIKYYFVFIDKNSIQDAKNKFLKVKNELFKKI